MKEEWVSMREAAERLKAEGYKTSANKISLLARRGAIQTKNSIFDVRVRLVELNELRKAYESDPRHGNKGSNGSAALDDDENDES